MLSNWPTAILHADADCFYASCEMLKDPSLRGKPIIVTSSVGGITLAKSYEAKPFGIKTGTPEWEAKKMCPGIIIKPVDFHFYANISIKINNIFRTISPVIEKYSIDESFIDLTGLRGYHHKSYARIGELLRQKIKNGVGINVSVGISLSKTLAKIAADFNKPDGLQIVPKREIEEFLKNIELEEIPGIGKNRAALLEKFGIKNSFDFYKSSEEKVKKLLGKTGVELWMELRGEKVYEVKSETTVPKSIMRSSSFQALSKDRNFIWGQTVRHCERVVGKLCEQNVLTSRITIFLRTKDFRYLFSTMKLPRPTLNFKNLVQVCKYLFQKTYKDGIEYRSAGVLAGNLTQRSNQQLDVFGRFVDDEKSGWLNTAKLKIRHKYGVNSIMPAASLIRKKIKQERGLEIMKVKLD